VREWIDHETGRTVRQLTDEPDGAQVGYFRVLRRLPNGWILAQRERSQQSRKPGAPLIAINVESGDIARIETVRGTVLGLNEGEGRLWFLSHDDKRSVCAVDLPHGTPEIVGTLPENWPRHHLTITCDGRTVVASACEVDASREYPPPTTLDPERFWAWTSRPRRGRLLAFDLLTRHESTLAELEGVMPIHNDASPTCSTLLKFAHDDFDAHCQRIWAVRTDGSRLNMIRPQERGETVTHEFWWPNGQSIAYKYQDRRNDPTVHDLPWSEYSPIATQLGLSNLEGHEWYLSDPLNHYHSHINVSSDGQLLCGEGTHDHSFVYAAAFSPRDTRINFVPLATIHTPYVPFRGQQVHASFARDNRWIVYNDTIEDKLQVCAVRVDL
jgi:hypothetical protein